jgi:hypothetical protein
MDMDIPLRGEEYHTFWQTRPIFYLTMIFDFAPEQTGHVGSLLVN